MDQLKKSVSRNTGFDCVMRVRCSAGERSVCLSFCLSVCHSDKTINLAVPIQV